MLIHGSRLVWLLFKILELSISLACCIVHNAGAHLMFTQIPDILCLCAAYGGGSIMVALSLICMFFTNESVLYLEAVLGGFVGTMHLMAVYAHMYLIQYDPQLPFLRDNEKLDTQFYITCQTNAHLALCAVGIYYLHFFLALDLILTDVDDPRGFAHPQISKQPLQLFLISKGVQEYLCSFHWFAHLTEFMDADVLIRRSKLQNSIFNILASNR